MTTAVQERIIDWVGISGKSYRYWIYPIGTKLQAKAGNYIFAKEASPGHWVPIYVGQTGDLDLRFDGHHKAACIKRAGATHVHARLSGDEAARLAEESDLIARWNPPCNG